MGYNKKMFSKVNDHKVLHKVKKQWIVISMATLALLGGGAAVHKISAHAETINHVNRPDTLRERLNHQLIQTNSKRGEITPNSTQPGIKDIGHQANQLHDRIIQNSTRLHLAQNTVSDPIYNPVSVQSSRNQSDDARGNGVNLDCARIYYTPQQIEQYINLVHNNGGQYLQLHLTDDQNFGIENDYLHNNKANGYQKAGTWYNKQTNQPFLTKSDLSSIVSYGKSQNVAVDPEFEMPAHSKALIKLVQLAYGSGTAYNISAGNPSQLDFENLPGISRERWPDTLDVIKSILKEYFFLPKGTRFGLGGDEIAGNLADASKAGGTTLSALVRFYNNIDNFLNQHGYHSIVYNDAFVKQPGLSGSNYYNKDIAVNYWSQSGDVSDKSPSSSAAQNLQDRYSMNDLTNLGYKVINNNANYLDLVAFSDNNCKKRTSILKQWTPGTWYGQNPNEKDDSPNVLGSAISIWSSDTHPYSPQQTINSVTPFIHTFFKQADQNAPGHPHSPNRPQSSVNEIIRFETVNGNGSASYVGDELISGQSGDQFNWGENQSDIPSNYQLSNDGTQNFQYGVASNDGLDKTIDHQIIHVVHVKSNLNNQIPVSDNLANVIGLINLHFSDGNGHDKVVPLNYAKQMTAKDGYRTNVLHDLVNTDDQVNRPSDLLDAESSILNTLGINSADYSYDSTNPNDSQSGSNGDYDKYGITAAQTGYKNGATATIKGTTFNFYFKGKPASKKISPNSNPVITPTVSVYYHLNNSDGQVLNSGLKLEPDGAILKASDVNKIATVPDGYTLESNGSSDYPVNGNTVINLVVTPKSINSDSTVNQQGIYVTMLYKNHGRVTHSSDQYIPASDLGKYGANKIGDHYTIPAPNSNYQGYRHSNDQSLTGTVTPDGLTHSAVTFIYDAMPKKINVQYMYGNLKEGQSTPIQADPGSDITVNSDTVPNGFHIVPGQRLAVPSDSYASDKIPLKVAPNDDSSYVTVNLVYKFGKKPVHLVDDLPVPVNLKPGQTQTISADTSRFMKPGFEPVANSDFTINYQNDPAKYPQMNHTYVYEAQPVDIKIAYKDGRQFVKKNGSLVNDESQLNSSDYADLGNVGINGQDIDVHADGGTQVGVITGQGIYNKNGTPVNFSIPTGYHLSHNDNLIMVSPSADSSGAQQVTAQGIPVMTLALSGEATASNHSASQNTTGAPITIRYINEDNGQEAGNKKVLDGNLGAKADVASSDASQGEAAGMNVPNGYTLDTDNLPGHPDRTDPKHPLYQFTAAPQILNLPVRGVSKQFTFHLHVISDRPNNQIRLLDDIPIQVNGRIGQSFTVNPYYFKATNDSSALTTQLPNEEFKMPRGYHVTNSDDDVTIRINSDGLPSAQNVFYFYQKNSAPKAVGTVRIHYVTDSDDTVRNHIDSATGDLTDGHEIDQVSDKGLTNNQFNLTPYLNDVPESISGYYQSTNHVFDINGKSVPDQQWYFTPGNKDIYIQIQPKDADQEPIIVN